MNDRASSVRDRSGLGVNTETIKQVKTELVLPESVANDINGLRQVYAAWCSNMTFDNVRKFVSLRSGDKQLGGGEAEEGLRNGLGRGPERGGLRGDGGPRIIRNPQGPGIEGIHNAPPRGPVRDHGAVAFHRNSG